jgi:hypothetical protein
MSRFKDEYLSYKVSTPCMIPDFSDFQRRASRGREGFDGGRSWFMERHSLRMNLLVTALIAIRLYLI